MLARITAVADVYDALTSSRSYRQAWPHEDAMRYLAENRDGQFDPECIDHWLALNKHVILKEQFLVWVKNTAFAEQVSEVGVV